MAKGFDEILKTLDLMKNTQIQEQAVGDTYPVVFNRIFESNLDSSGNDLRELSDKAVYINTAKAGPKKLPAKGKDGKGKFKNGKAKVTTYFPGGYRQYKKAIGNRKKLELFGDLRSSFVYGYFGGKLSYGFLEKSEAIKAEWNEDTFGTTIFHMTDEEIEYFRRRYTKLLGL